MSERRRSLGEQAREALLPERVELRIADISALRELSQADLDAAALHPEAFRRVAETLGVSLSCSTSALMAGLARMGQAMEAARVDLSRMGAVLADERPAATVPPPPATTTRGIRLRD
jgi:hypothetical protein